MYEKSLELLNRAVGDELSAVHQYMYFHFHCDDQGFDLLAALFKKVGESVQNRFEYVAGRDPEEDIPLKKFELEEFSEVES